MSKKKLWAGRVLTALPVWGATATHVRIADPAFVIAVLVGVLVWAGLYLRESRLAPLLPFRT